MTENLVVAGIIACAVSGIPGLLLGRHTCIGQWLASAVISAGCILGLAGAAAFWSSNEAPKAIRLPWHIPGGEFHVAIDGLSAFFLVPIFLVALLGSIYGLSYWKQTDHPSNARKLRLFYGLLAAGMALVVIARNSLLFLAAWEIMALAAYFLVTTEDDDKDVREAGWIFLLAAHTSTLCLFGLFALLYAANGSFEIRALPGTASSELSAGIFVLALVGFGLKAGIMPLHVWLPSSHAMAPSHVSAIMSGVIIKMGIYGLVRTTSLLPNPPAAWGGIVLALGAVSGVLGVAYAVGQHDLKRLLAYHSIENIGIIVMGVGLALLGRSLERADLVILGLGGGLLHVWNHAFFKGLLFLSAGSVIHAAHTREIDHLGGLSKRMPRTSLCFLVGAAAICGLPPLNGFVSEFLVYLGLFRTLQGSSTATVLLAGAAFAAPALALIGALAVACFVKVFGAVFLGTPRSEHAEHAGESPATMIGPMFVLVACCIIIGALPVLLTPVLTRAILVWAPDLPASTGLTALAPLGWITAMALVLVAALALGGALLQARLRRSEVAAGPTWGCGYVAPSPRIQYTSSSFAQMLVELFAWALRPRVRAPQELPLFPQQTSFHSDVPDAVLEEGIRPAFQLGGRFFGWFRVLQQGSIQMYLLYIFLTLFTLLLWRYF